MLIDRSWDSKKMAKWILYKTRDVRISTAFIDNDIDGSLLPQLADVDSKIYKSGILDFLKEKNNLATLCRTIILFGEVKR